MKKSSKILIAVVIVIAVLAVIYRAVNRAPSADLTANEQLLQILEDGGCAECHSADPKLPFYANWPIAKSLITKHIVDGYATFDIMPFEEALTNGTAPNEVDLAKVERCLSDGSMPLAQYYLVHWGSSVTGAKEAIALEAVRQLRAQFYPNTLAAAEFANEPIRPIPDSVPFDEKKAALGNILYHDTRLSADGTVSCATCHGLTTGGVDNKRYSEGIKGQLGGVNAPTVYNAVFNFVQFWDGRAATLAEQAGGPPLNPVEMGCSSFDEIVARLSEDKEFVKEFTAVYPEGLSQATITDAIGEFEKTLVTPNSAFDRYLKGDKTAMTTDQIEGYALFKEYNCATCHAGVNMGGLTYELMGQRDNYFEDRDLTLKSGLTDGDNGRWAQTGVERDRYRFKTPGLRNVALTYPYYHDGSVKTLSEAIDKMARFQVGRKISAADNKKVESFLNALTGEYNGVVLTNTNGNSAEEAAAKTEAAPAAEE